MSLDELEHFRHALCRDVLDLALGVGGSQYGPVLKLFSLLGWDAQGKREVIRDVRAAYGKNFYRHRHGVFENYQGKSLGAYVCQDAPDSFLHFGECYERSRYGCRDDILDRNARLLDRLHKIAHMALETGDEKRLDAYSLALHPDGASPQDAGTVYKIAQRYLVQYATVKSGGWGQGSGSRGKGARQVALSHQRVAAFHNGFATSGI